VVVAEDVAGDGALPLSLFPRSPDDRPAASWLASAIVDRRRRPMALRKALDPAADSGRNSTPARNASAPRAWTRATRNHSKRRSPSNSTSSHPTIPTCSGMRDSIEQPPLLMSRMTSGTFLSNTALVIAIQILEAYEREGWKRRVWGLSEQTSAGRAIGIASGRNVDPVHTSSRALGTTSSHPLAT
jgi:hypothetical protein